MDSDAGSRRRRLAAMAGSLYRSGQQAVSDLRDRSADKPAPGAEQMVLFPSYARRDGAATVVDVRGWLFCPAGPTRRSRLLVGLARQLSGVDVPDAGPPPAPGPAAAGPSATLEARLAPFLTRPLAGVPLTVFLYDDARSAARPARSDDAGRFALRAAVGFVPTHVRVLAELPAAARPAELAAAQPVRLVPPRGVGLISDVDDTVKVTDMPAGPREVFRNTFVRDLADLTVDGVGAWYRRMAALGVALHYCSNCPWELFPVLDAFFGLAALPPGSVHLKRYAGMLQGFLEPVAERKRPALARILADFPQRRFLLVGDSFEADLEVYTDLALEHPGRILAVFIRDVTTDEPVPPLSLDEPPRSAPEPPGPLLGTLIDLSEEPAETTIDRSAALAQLRAKPPRPAKPPALRGAPSVKRPSSNPPSAEPQKEDPDLPPPLPRRPPASPRLLVNGEPVRPLPPRSRSAGSPSGSPSLGSQPSRKLELWQRRLARAHDLLNAHGVALYTWRRGQDVAVEAEAIVRRALAEDGLAVGV